MADQRAAYRAAETQQHEEELSCAVAASLAEVDPEPVCRAPGEWDCLRCTRTNTADAGRCASCESDRMAPFASARPAAVTEVRCGLAGCSRLKAVRDYCCLEHENRALGRRIEVLLGKSPFRAPGGRARRARFALPAAIESSPEISRTRIANTKVQI